MRRILDNPERIATIMRDVAATEVLPRFQTLSTADIDEKRPGDLVTTADRMSEAAFRRLLPPLLPGSRVLGEEGYETDPASLELLNGDAPVWIVDPVDGTFNFAHGKPPFTVIVALASKGRTLGGWIVDPIVGDAVFAIEGEGAAYAAAESDFSTISANGSPGTLAASRMTAGARLRNRMETAAADVDGAELPIFVDRYRCVGREYMDIATGKLELARYGGRLKPWDHAAGALIVRESGGIASVVDKDEPYMPRAEITSRAIGVSINGNVWTPFRDLVARADGLTSLH